MTIEDRIRASMAAQVQSPPELPGLFSSVSARARVVRRTRRVAAAVVTCAAVTTIAVVLAVNGSGNSKPIPSNPSPLPSVSASPRPSVAASSTPTAVSKTSTGPSPVVVTATSVPPPAPALGFPVGAAPALPLLFANGKQLALQDNGQTYPLGNGGSPYEQAVISPYGMLIVSGTHLDLVDSHHRIATLPDTDGLFAGCGLPALSPDGRYVAWGRQTGLDKPRKEDQTLPGEYGLYDLKTRQVVKRVTAAAQGCPADFLADGRVLMTTGDGAVNGAALWTPSTGDIEPIRTGTVSLAWPQQSSMKVAVRAVGDGCSLSLVRGGKTSYLGFGSCGDLALSPDGHRLLSPELPLSGDIVDAGIGVVDARLSELVKAQHLSVEDAVWLDGDHVVLLALRTRAAASRSTYTYRWVLTCAVPVGGQVSCTQNQQVAPVLTHHGGKDSGVPYGAVPFLVHNG
jgi:hypothetical protein